MRNVLWVALLLAWTGPAHAAGDGGPSWSLLILQVFNTALLLGIIIRYGGPPIRSWLRERSRGIRAEIEAAEERVRSAETEISQLRERLAGMEAETARILRVGEEQAQIERERGVERANEAAERIRAEAERVAGQEVERARLELQAEAAELATQVAADLMRDNLQPADDQRLIAEFIERVGEPS
jgi:F-type H+-transporting ATPase subunit b